MADVDIEALELGDPVEWRLEQAHWRVGRGARVEGRPVRFSGWKLCSYTTRQHDATAWVSYEVYLVASGRLVVHRHGRSLWEGALEEDGVRVFPDLDAFREAYDDGEHGTALVLQVEEALGLDTALTVE